jgi:hypothetical protein
MAFLFKGTMCSARLDEAITAALTSALRWRRERISLNEARRASASLWQIASIALMYRIGGLDVASYRDRVIKWEVKNKARIRANQLEWSTAVVVVV